MNQSLLDYKIWLFDGIKSAKRARLSCSISESSDCGNDSKSKRGQLSGTSLLTTHSFDLDFTLWAAWRDRIDALTSGISCLAFWALIFSADTISAASLVIVTLINTNTAITDALLTIWASWELADTISVSDLISGALSNTNAAITDALLTSWASWELAYAISVPDLIRGALSNALTAVTDALFSGWAVHELADTTFVSFLISFAFINASASAIDSLLAFAAKSLADTISVSLLSISVHIVGTRSEACIGAVSQEMSGLASWAELVAAIIDLFLSVQAATSPLI